MSIEEGYAIMAFDYTVKKSNYNCLFNMKETLLDREKYILSLEEKRKGN